MGEDPVAACPECDRASVQSQSRPRSGQGSEDVDTYRCQACKETFDEPNFREPRGPSNIRGDSLAAKLDAMEVQDG